MNDFAMEMVVDTSEEWTAKKRFERFKEYLTRAADQTLGRIKCGKGKRKLKKWWDGKVKEAIKARKEACRTLRKRKNSMSSAQMKLWETRYKTCGETIRRRKG